MYIDRYIRIRGYLIAVPLQRSKVLKTATGQIKNVEDLQDRLLSGKYMITAIKHMFSKDDNKVDYRMGLELSKDGVEELVPWRKSRKED